MSFYNTWLYRVVSGISTVIGWCDWDGILAKLRKDGKGYNLTDDDLNQIKELLAQKYYLILTYRKTHLSTYIIGLLTFIKTGKWPAYDHVLMNLDLVDNPADSDKFKLMEATNQGVHYSGFMEVFNCDRVCIIEPNNMDNDAWNAVIQGLIAQNGLPYDNVFDIKDPTHVSCVELVLDALRKDPNYVANFPNLEAMIAKVGNLTPQMYRDCPDFKVVYEVKR